MQNFEIDSALSPLAPLLHHAADNILDLREAALKREDPGLCISCYFKIYAASPDRHRSAISPLRRWLETHLEIVAHDENRTELERIPVSLDGEDLEGYCHRIMSEFHLDRAYRAANIELGFRFRTDTAA